MFSNIGSKVKTLALVMFTLGVIASVVGAIVLWASSSRYYSTFWIGLATLAGGILGSWLSTCVIYAVGEAADNSAAQICQNEKIMRVLSEIKNNMGKPEDSRSNASSSEQARHTSNSRLNLGSVANGSIPGSVWTCKKCGCENQSSAISCIQCGNYK